MRIIHDVEAPMQTSGGGNPYGASQGMQGYNGLRIDLMATESPASNHPELSKWIFSDEVIYIEGNSKYIKAMLESWIAIIDFLEESYRNGCPELNKPGLGEERLSNCPNCKPEDIQPNVSHLVSCPMHTNYAMWQPGGKYYKEPTESERLLNDQVPDSKSDPI